MKAILLYLDHGVDKPLVESLHDQLKEICHCNYVTAKDLTQGDCLNAADLLIIPGGRDLPYVRRLHTAGTANIKTFVTTGGHFLGICAGAYFGSSYVEFDKGGPLQINGKRELQFFPGKAIGPVYGPYSYTSQIGARIIPITYQEGTARFLSHCYYNGGCFFEPIDSPHIQVLATYENGSPSIVRCECGQGRAILSGVHFEKPLRNPSQEANRQRLMSALIAQLL